MNQLPVGARTDAATPQVRPFQVLSDSRDNLTRKLRVSLVDSCNLNCFFCHNEGQGEIRRSSTSALSINELTTIIDAASRAGIREVKLTGGEPLLYRHAEHTIVDVVREIDRIRSREHFGLSITTNGLLLPKFATSLANAGLDRVTVSLHTLRDATFRQLLSRSRSQKTEKVVDGINAAIDAGLTPVKVNTVLFHSATRHEGNLDELRDIINLCRSIGVSQLRLYTLLRHPEFEEHAEWYQRLDERILKGAGNAVLGDDVDAAQFARTAREFLDSARSIVYPRPHLVLGDGSFELMVEALESGQFDAVGLPDEGPYALRVSSDGHLRGLISEQDATINLAQMIRTGKTVDDLSAVLRNARLNAMPENPEE